MPEYVNINKLPEKLRLSISGNTKKGKVLKEEHTYMHTRSWLPAFVVKWGASAV